MRQFFKESDDFFHIIHSKIDNVQKIESISTGWTNFVFRATSPSGGFIFRFPRNEFFARALVKECRQIHDAKKFVKSFSIPKLQLFHFHEIPFSCHKSLPGRPLNELDLSEERLSDISREICLFLSELESWQNFSSLQKTSEFLCDLSHVSEGGYDLSRHLPLEEAEKGKLVACHGDFNPGNILISDGHVVSVIDFAFLTKSSPLTDVARLMSRSDERFCQIFLEEYQNYFNLQLDKKSLIKIREVYHYVDAQYISYIKRAHPSIDLSKF